MRSLKGYTKDKERVLLSNQIFGVGTSNPDTRIFYDNDLIAIVQDTINVLSPADFIFVDDSIPPF